MTVPTWAAVACALVLTGPALLRVAEGDLDLRSAAIRFVLALPVSLLALAVVATALRPSVAQPPPERRSTDGDPDERLLAQE